MRGLFKWLNEEENRFFVLHVAFVLVLAVLVELFLPTWTSFAYPGLLLLAVLSFLLNYPANAIKSHGLFSEYLIELRLLWLVMLGVFSEYLVYQFFEKNAITLTMVVALLVGILLLFYGRGSLQEKVVKARGFK